MDPHYDARQSFENLRAALEAEDVLGTKKYYEELRSVNDLYFLDRLSKDETNRLEDYLQKGKKE